MALSDEAKALARKVGEAVRGTAEEVDRIAKAVEDVMAHVLAKVEGSTSSASVSDPPKTSPVESTPATGPSPESTPGEVTQPANGETTTRLSD